MKLVCPTQLTFTTKQACGRQLFGSSGHCYWHTEGIEKYDSEQTSLHFGPGVSFRTALEAEVAAGRSMELAFLVSAPLGGSFLSTGSNLRGAIFIRANLADARLSYSNLSGANLSFCNLQNAYLSDCDLTDTKFIGAKLFNTKFRNSGLTTCSGLSKQLFRGLRWGWCPEYRMFEEQPVQSEAVYRSLASRFASEGLLDDASWATYRACLMKHAVLRHKLSFTQFWAEEVVTAMMNDPNRAMTLMQSMPGISPRKRSSALFLGRAGIFLEWLRSLTLRIIVGYGEKPLRVLWFGVAMILFYACVYSFCGAIGDRSFESCLYFSAITFTTVGYGDLVPHGVFRLLAASEALLGILLCGLFLFCLGRRSVGRP